MLAWFQNLKTVGADMVIFSVKPHAEVGPGKIGMNRLQRALVKMPLDEMCELSPFEPPAGGFLLTKLSLEIDFVSKKKDRKVIDVDQAKVAESVKVAFVNQVFAAGQELAIPVDVEGEGLIDFKVKVVKTEVLTTDNEAAAPRAAGGAAAAGAGTHDGYGLFNRDTEVVVTRAGDAVGLRLTGQTESKSRAPISTINFEKLGIGGLNKEFAQIFRRAFASRVAPPAVLKMMGISHVKGMLLYGPPGCGKTLIARKIGKSLSSGREPKIVNGPEILNKFVGASEENIRLLFKDAEVGRTSGRLGGGGWWGWG